MNNRIFKIMGSLLLSFATVFVLGGAVTVLRHTPKGVSDLLPLVTVAAAMILVGVGLYHSRKWAAVGLCLLLLYAAYWEVQGAIHPIPGYWSWLGFVWATLLLLPVFIVAKYWGSLVWRRRA
jgi:hypothetical protein